MDIVSRIRTIVQQAIAEKYQQQVTADVILINETKPEFEGNYTVVLFSFVKSLKRSPEVLGKELGEFLITKFPDLFSSFNVIKGFLNLTISDEVWLQFLSENYSLDNFGWKEKNGKKGL